MTDITVIRLFFHSSLLSMHGPGKTRGGIFMSSCEFQLDHLTAALAPLSPFRFLLIWKTKLLNLKFGIEGFPLIFWRFQQCYSTPSTYFNMLLISNFGFGCEVTENHKDNSQLGFHSSSCNFKAISQNGATHEHDHQLNRGIDDPIEDPPMVLPLW